MKLNLIFLICIILLPLTIAFDDETLQICGGDEQTLILCSGDLENSPIGKNVYTAPSVASPQGGALSIVGSRFNTGLICNRTKEFLLENIINETTKKELLFKINNESTIFISQSVIDQYINNFEGMCNMTIEEKKEIIKKAVFPFIFILLIGLIGYSYYHRKKIIKFIIVFFDDEDEYDSTEDIERD